MNQLEIFDIPSPCINVCQVNNRGYCKGCFRSREERLHWFEVDNITRHKIIEACKARKKRVLAKKRQQELEAQQLASAPNTQFSFFADEEPD